MKFCEYVNDIKCHVPGETLPSQAIVLNVGDVTNPTGETDIRACHAAGWTQWQQICTGNSEAQPLSLILIKNDKGSITPWMD